MAEVSLHDLISAITEGIPEEGLAFILMSTVISVAIATKRVDMGMTQKEFSEYMGVSQAMVSKWESGEANFTLKTLAQIAVKLGIDVRSPFVIEHAPAHLKYRGYDHDNILQFPCAESWSAYSTADRRFEEEELEEM